MLLFKDMHTVLSINDMYIIHLLLFIAYAKKCLVTFRMKT